MSDIERKFIRVSEQMTNVKQEVGHKFAELTFQIYELRVETDRLRTEVALLREAVEKRSASVSIPFRGTIS